MKTVAVVGATGAVGQEFAEVLSTRNFPATSYRLLASERSAGRTLDWAGHRHKIETLRPGAFDGIDLAFFSAGGEISRRFIPQARAAGAVVVDNSSAFRLDPDVPLVVPEVNPEAIHRHQGLIANPNCSTILLAAVLWPLHRQVPIERVVVSTYQAVSGAGARAIDELCRLSAAALAREEASPEVFSTNCAFNVFSHDSAVGDDGFNLEERKLIDETRKIFGIAEFRVAPTCVRVPVFRAHTESVAIEFSRQVAEADAREWLAAAPGISLVDNRAANVFPTPRAATGRDEILVGRLRPDPSVPDGRGLQLMLAGDQLRKGAALNAVQIAELLPD